jgi:hypothetical protein
MPLACCHTLWDKASIVNGQNMVYFRNNDVHWSKRIDVVNTYLKNDESE